jgi:hypothetical protein
VETLRFSAAREETSFGAALSGGALYWPDDVNVRRTSVTGSARNTSLPVVGSLYENSSMLADADALHVLASGVPDSSSAVQLLRLQQGGEVSPLDTGGNKPVFQFGQDASAVYLAIGQDTSNPDRIRIDRRSSVIRIEKANGQRSTVLPEQAVTVRDPNRGGYVGVQVDGSAVYSVFEAQPADDGTVRVRVDRVLLEDGAPAGEPQALFDATIDPAITRIDLLGVTDGDVLLSRIDFDPALGSLSVRSSSVLSLPRSGAEPRLVAEFALDYALQGLSVSSDRIFWLNRSGDVYALPRNALAITP